MDAYQKIIILLLPASSVNSDVISESVKGLMDCDYLSWGGVEFQEAKAAHVTAEETRSGTFIISSEASTALCSTRCSAAYSCFSPSEGRVQQRHRRPLGLTGCDAALPLFSFYSILFGSHHQVKAVAEA